MIVAAVLVLLHNSNYDNLLCSKIYKNHIEDSFMTPCVFYDQLILHFALRKITGIKTDRMLILCL